MLRKKFTGRTRSAVVQLMDEARNARAKGLPVVDDRLTVGRFLDQWLASLPGTIAESSEHAYRTRVRLYLTPALGHLPLRRPAPSHVADLLAGMEAKGLSAETRRLTRAVLRRGLRHAEQEGFVGWNVAAIASGPRFERREGRTMTSEEARRFLATARRPLEPGKRGPAPTRPQRLYPALLVALGLGLRRGEVLGLSWNDVELDTTTPVLHVHRQFLRRPNGGGLGLTDLTTRKSRRAIALPPMIVTALKSHRALQAQDRLLAGSEWANTEDLVFTTPLSTPVDPRNVNEFVSKTSKAAGLGHWHPHELRHSAGSLLVAMGIPLEVVSDVLGHSSIRVTNDIYLHLLDGSRIAAAVAMATVLSG